MKLMQGLIRPWIDLGNPGQAWMSPDNSQDISAMRSMDQAWMLIHKIQGVSVMPQA